MEFYYISWDKIRPDKNRVFFFFFYEVHWPHPQILTQFLLRFFPCLISADSITVSPSFRNCHHRPWQPLQRIQITAVESFTTRKRDHITPVLKTLHWLPVKQRIMFKVLIFIFRCIHNTAPSYLTNSIVITQPKYGTRSADHITLDYKTPRNSYTERSYATYGPMLFNALPSACQPKSPTLSI